MAKYILFNADLACAGMLPKTQYTAVTLCIFRDVPRGLQTSKSSMYRIRLNLSSSEEKKIFF
jgi:hypothetical protein